MASNGKITNLKFFVLLAIVIVVVGVGILVCDQIVYRGYVRIKATIVGYEENAGYDRDEDRSSSTYAEIVSYTVDGKTYSAKNPSYSSKLKLETGKQIDIAYDPNDPSHCVFVASRIKLSMALIAIGGATMLVCIIIAVSKRRNTFHINSETLT
ncbi:MAG: DUF3592 domain-containing protein [Clostridia bacterium]|nr:DUF3592 domain-containing protein [Clostridia bacterium]